MADISTVWAGWAGDWALRGGDLVADDELATAVVLSLFTDRLAGASDELPGATDRRGWWGDAYAPVPGDLIGSRLWLLARAKRTPQTLRLAQTFIEEALQWMLQDGVAVALSVACEWAPGQASEGVMHVRVLVQRRQGADRDLRFAWATEPAPAPAGAGEWPLNLNGAWLLDGSGELDGVISLT